VAGRWQVTLTPGDTIRGGSRGADRREQVDAVLLTQPVPQILALLSASSVEVPAGMAQRLAGVRYDPCICLLLDQPDGEASLPEPGGVRIDDPASPVAWIASQWLKGLRPSGEGLVLHFRGAWSAERFSLSDEALLDEARAAAAPVLERLGIDPLGATAELKKWRYSLATATLPERCLRLDAGAPLVLAGDAFGDTPRVEGAWLSGRAAALALGDAG
jgi:predicted NAD/FAD-dependent oxidoreductase